MGVFMGLRPMGRMVVIVGSVLTRVIVVMDFASLGMAVVVTVLMEVLVVVYMGVFVAMFASVVGMFVQVSMGMVVAMQMFVFVFSFHGELLLWENSI